MITLTFWPVVANPVTLPVKLPVTLPKTLPKRFPSTVAKTAVPAAPENTSLVLVPLGINVNLLVESWNPKKPVAAVPDTYLNSMPLSLLSSAGGCVPPRPDPITNIGSLRVDIVESTVIVVPFTVKLPDITVLPERLTVPPDELSVRLPVVVVIKLPALPISTPLAMILPVGKTIVFVLGLNVKPVPDEIAAPATEPD